MYLFSRVHFLITISGLFLVSGLLATPLLSEEEGTPCGPVEFGEQTGICAIVPDCPPAMEALQKHRVHNFQRCGFNGFNEIVCCPKDEVSDGVIDRTNSGPDMKYPGGLRKCERACKEYNENIKPSRNFLIINGLDTELGEFPHMVALGYEKPGEDEVSWECGGTLISDNYVITAGHCIFKKDDIPPTIARMGIVNITGPNLGTNQNATPQDYRIESTTVHPDFSWPKRIHDIALIKLKEKVTMSEFIYPACLYTKNDDPVDLIITGWGNTERNSPEISDTLKKANVVPVPLPECNSTILTRGRKAVTENHICAFHNISDTCYGDSGGPMQSKNTRGNILYNIVGITSYGLGCAGRYPSVYTRVSMYVDWIEKIVWP